MATPIVYKKADIDADPARAEYKTILPAQRSRTPKAPNIHTAKQQTNTHNQPEQNRLGMFPQFHQRNTQLNLADLQHQMCKLILDGKLGLAPVPSPKHVLDVATGTGIWALEYAKNNPQANVIGTDLFTMQPATAAPNVSFVRQDVEKEEWNYPHPFDYIHLRYIVSCFDDAQSVFRKAHAALRPGGYIEIFDLVLHPRYSGDKRGPALDKWCSAVCAAATREGRDLRKAERYKQWLEEIGFVDVVDVEMMLPGNAWSEDDKIKEIGALLVQVQPGPLLTLGTYFGARGLSGVLDGLAPEMMRDMEDESIHLCWPM
ncbi:S-adenosylmethionine-dependent methyltransferase [Metarhizium acridum CQMa 102]|uniref:S-adenosylmethionine-dependent methyltransferase n=1 Tax=Metarhizium acridum (strain CQMa 102) TaxID=655827 RepID=E9EHP9_METAQ|nr:S-adenosylmethionine-dependent methyltransferase [Metarhizium acridum CQMa 102]EFY84551.1 S-adenosylmethionine-dependent methyltransferase [Metarhizium acridum CQMa 102]